MAKTYEILCNHYKDEHDRKNGIISKTDCVFESESLGKAREEFDYRASFISTDEELVLWVDEDEVGRAYDPNKDGE